MTTTTPTFQAAPAEEFRRMVGPAGRQYRRYFDWLPEDDRWGKLAESKNFPNITSICGSFEDNEFWKQIDDGEGGKVRVPLDAKRVADYVARNMENIAAAYHTNPQATHLNMAKAAQRDLGKAADRGTEGHRILESRLAGQEVFVLNADIEPYLDTIDRVVADFQGKVAALEVVVFSRSKNYAGTVDLFIRTENGLGAYDFKFRGPDSRHGCYGKEVGQLGLAALGEYMMTVNPDGQNEMPFMRTPLDDLPITELGIISIKADGYETFPVDVDGAKNVASRAIEIKQAKQATKKTAREATGDPIPMPMRLVENPDLAPGATPRETPDQVAQRMAVEQPDATPAEVVAAAFPGATTYRQYPDGQPIDVERARLLIADGFARLGLHDDSPARALFDRWLKQADDTPMSWRMSENPSERRLELYKLGSWMAATFAADPTPDTEAAELICIIAPKFLAGNEPQPTLSDPVGILIGSLRIDIAQAITASLRSGVSPDQAAEQARQLAF